MITNIKRFMVIEVRDRSFCCVLMFVPMVVLLMLFVAKILWGTKVKIFCIIDSGSRFKFCHSIVPAP